MRIYLYLLLISISCSLVAQPQWQAMNVMDSTVLVSFGFKHQHCDSVYNMLDAEAWSRTLITEGYYESAFKIVKIDSCYSSVWRVGKQYQGINLSYEHLPLSLVKFANGLTDEDGFLTSADMKSIIRHGLALAENRGYPFASFRLDSVQISNEISARLSYNPGSKITFGSILIKGNESLKENWLAGYLGIINGSDYDHSQVNAIQGKINKLPFVSLVKPPEVIFHNNTADINLEFEDEPASHVDAIIGFLPNEAEQGKLLVTGQIDLSLGNLFKSAKALDLTWQSLKPRSQLLEIDYQHPRLFNSPLLLTAGFGLIKEDTIFINRTTGISIGVESKHVDISGVFKNHSSTSFIERSDSAVSDLSIDSYGLKLSRNHRYTDLGLQGGIEGGIEGYVGNRTAQSLESSKSALYELNALIRYKVHVSKNIVFQQQLNGAMLLGNSLFLNDLFRLGGLKSLRGFNENHFFADRYGLVRSELRLYYKLDSYIFTFYDQAILSFKTVDSDLSDRPFALGVGMAIKLKQGFLNLVYAAGQSDNQALDTRLSKIHFGYVTTF